MTRLLLVRHGETRLTSEGRAQGWADVPLSDPGRCQANQLAARLKSFQIGAAFTSDLSRAVETTEILLGNRGALSRSCSCLREQHYGDWEGRSYQQVQAEDPERYARLMTCDPSFAPPGGESIDDVVQRARQALTTLRSCGPESSNILVVGHAGSIRALVVLLLDLPRSAFWKFKVSLASLSVIGLYPEGATLDLWNDTRHLEEPGGR